MANKINIVNKKASFNYELLEKYTAGIVLKGTEIKSVRLGKASIKEAFCFFRDNELFVRNMHISEYKNRGYVNHEAEAERKLLLNKSELKKLHRKIKEKGLTIVVTRLFISNNGLAKLNIALAKGKREFDKREDIKKKDLKLQSDRRLKV